jgi:alkylation response protein AidB-like acyl-CoA dehydrogenase/acyl carrier protein
MVVDQLESQHKAEELISWIRQYASTRINSRVMDERRTIAPHIILDLGNKGILGMQVPKRYGGLELSTVDLMRVIQQLTAIDMTLGTFVGLNNWLGIWPIQMYADEEVKQELLPRLAWGRELAAFAFTEPGAGSDARSIKTVAVPTGPQQQAITGEKSWIGSGAWAGVTTVFVQQLDEQQRPSGISGYVLKADTPGLSQGPEALTMGMRAMIQNTVKFDAAQVDEKYLLGTKNFGMDIAQDIMMHARLGIAGLSLGGMKRCAQLMLRYARRRKISTGLLLDNPVTQARLSDVSAAITAIDTLVFSVGRFMDQGMAIPSEVFTACKSSAPELFGEAADHLTQLLGARGYIETNGAPQLLRDARILRVFEGPTETMNMYLGGRILKGSADFFAFLETTLLAPHIGQAIAQAARQIQEQANTHTFLQNDALMAKKWVQYKVGEVSTYGVLQGFLYLAMQSSNEPRFKRAYDWASAHFDRLKEAALRGTPCEGAFNGIDAVCSEIDDLMADIADIEQQLPADNQLLDAYLQKDVIDESHSEVLVPARHAGPASSESPASVAVRQSQGPSAVELQHWIKAWIAQCIAVSPEQISGNEPFTSFGLDSTDAVEIVHDLEQFLGLELDATLLWNYPCIDELAAYLRSELASREDVGQRVVEQQDTPKAETPSSREAIDSMTDEQVMDLLMKEISA